MSPTTWGTVLAFLAFVAPGLFYDLLRARREINSRESTFREISRITFVSTVCSSIAVVLTVGVLFFCRALGFSATFPRPQALLLGDAEFLVQHLLGITILLIVAMTVSLFAAWFLERLLRRGKPGNVSNISLWASVFRKDKPDDSDVFLRVKLLNGSSWSGKLTHSSPDPELEERELALGSPLEFKATDGTSHRIEGWQRVLISGNQIESIAVKYQATKSSEPPKNTVKNWGRRVTKRISSYLS